MAIFITRDERKSRLSDHLHGHYSLFDFIHRNHNNVWDINAYSPITKTRFALLASNAKKDLTIQLVSF